MNPRDPSACAGSCGDPEQAEEIARRLQAPATSRLAGVQAAIEDGVRAGAEKLQQDLGLKEAQRAAKRAATRSLRTSCGPTCAEVLKVVLRLVVVIVEELLRDAEREGGIR